MQTGREELPGHLAQGVQSVADHNMAGWASNLGSAATATTGQNLWSKAKKEEHKANDNSIAGKLTGMVTDLHKQKAGATEVLTQLEEQLDQVSMYPE